MATIACGITVKVLGETFINDYALTLHFWQVTAVLLNTLLFVLGGCLWGDLLSKDTFSTTAEDWGYLALLFVILIAIRFLLVFGLYPLTSRIGIGTNVKESIFMSYGGKIMIPLGSDKLLYTTLLIFSPIYFLQINLRIQRQCGYSFSLITVSTSLQQHG